ncbi:MAG TPA: aldo/keto reductase [Rhodoglobus sp.]|nr:aldo/keto reductase [Rhodoglobus sp.]HPM52383.1 aldo/keto reductase [Rhodoglobus sp.]HQJ35271.1 aldo/keto reductase [Rhodoglobus sp.]
MQSRRIGNVTVSAIGLGGMPLSIDGRPDREQALATILAAIDSGVTLIDTADSYTMEIDGQGHNELLIAEALKLRPTEAKNILVATKGGLIYRTGRPWDRNGKPEYLRQAAIDSARRLGVESIGLYQYHRQDYTVAYTDSLGAMKDLLDEGLIQMAGISNAITEQIALFDEMLDGRLMSVQNRFSPIFQSSRPELDYTVEHGMAFLPWSPLGGIGNGSEVFDSSAFAAVGAELGVSAQQVALAWELSLGDSVIPIPGASRPASITDSALASELVLTPEQLARLGA